MATNMDDYCPLNEAGHRYFVAYGKPINEYEPVPHDKVIYRDERKDQLYKRIEYAYLGCNCGSTIKTPIKQRN